MVKNVCRILEYRDIKDTLSTKVNKAYKINLSGINVAGVLPATPTTYNEGEIVYISEPGFYQLELCSPLRVVFSSRLAKRFSYKKSVKHPHLTDLFS